MFKIKTTKQNRGTINVFSKHFINPLFCCFLIFSPLTAFGSTDDQDLNKKASFEFTAETMQKMQSTFDAHLKEFEEMKPALKRLIKSEKDLAYLVAALDQISSLPNKPNKKQLLEPKKFADSKKETKKASTVNKPIAKKTMPKPAVVIKKEAVVKKQTAKVAPKPKSKPKTLPQLVKKGVNIGIHLASYRKEENVAKGWTTIDKRFHSILQGKTPVSQQVMINNRLYLRLIAGKFDSKADAQKTCKKLENKKQFCQVIYYKIQN